MRFFLDENFPKSAETLLIERGHAVFDIRGTDAEGAEDQDIFAMAQERQAVFLTTDRDFFHTIPHILKDHWGVVVIALRQPNRQAIADRLTWFLDRADMERLKGKAYLLRDRAYAVYPADA